MRTLALLLLVACVVPGVSTDAAARTTRKPADPPRKLKPDEIRSTFFTGQPFVATAPNGVRYRMTFTPNGQAAREPDGKSGKKGEGHWSLSKDGFCTTWAGSAGNCYFLFARDTATWIVSNGSTTLATWSK